jgi:hypothetical protein
MDISRRYSTIGIRRQLKTGPWLAAIAAKSLPEVAQYYGSHHTVAWAQDRVLCHTIWKLVAMMVEE